MFHLMDIGGSGLTAHKTWMETIGNNITNINTTRTEGGGPYKRQIVSFQEIKDFENILEKETGSGVKVNQILQDDSVKLVYNPEHPDANEEGYVEYPQINMIAEMTDLLTAQRGYQASATTLDTAKKMMEKTMDIGK